MCKRWLYTMGTLTALLWLWLGQACGSASQTVIRVQACKDKIETLEIFVVSTGGAQQNDCPALGNLQPKVSISFKKGETFALPTLQDNEQLLYRFKAQGRAPICQYCQEERAQRSLCTLPGPQLWCSPPPETVPERSTSEKQPDEASPKEQPDTRSETVPEAKTEAREVRTESRPEVSLESVPEFKSCRSAKDCSGAEICLDARCQVCQNDKVCKQATGDDSTLCIKGQCIKDGCRVRTDCRDRNAACINNKCERCTKDQDCGAGLRCIETLCMECFSTRGCSGGKVCNRGFCGPCQSDANCPKSSTGMVQICAKGVCQAGCQNDTACKKGELCEKGRCVIGNCRNVSDCPSLDFVCVQLSCRTPCKAASGCPKTPPHQCLQGGCVPLKTCNTATPCAKGYLCQTGYCRPGCNIDSDCPPENVCIAKAACISIGALRCQTPCQRKGYICDPNKRPRVCRPQSPCSPSNPCQGTSTYCKDYACLKK